jgi:DNA-3-methyladenine glycosylase
MCAMLEPLPRSFYEPSADLVARQLLGRWLIRRTKHGLAGGPIVETEAYVAGDPASHAFVGETSRNRVMWGPPGHAYVYLIYGFYFCVNAVCQPSGLAEAVLIRAIAPTIGREYMLDHRPVGNLHALTSGPGKLCTALHITRQLDGADLCDRRSPLFIAEHPDLDAFLTDSGPVVTTKRIGITKAADLPLRFVLEQSAFSSRARRGRGSGLRS